MTEEHSPNRPKVEIDPAKCKGYGDCESACRHNVFVFRVGKYSVKNVETWAAKCVVVNPESCTGCCDCLRACPAHAIALDIGETTTVPLNY